VRAAVPTLAALCAVALSACGNTLPDTPIPHSALEGMIVAPYPVYWLGGSFAGLAMTEGASDPGGAFTLQYGNCLAGGQGICTPPLRIVTSPDNSFVPGGSTRSVTTTIRGVGARVSQAGRTIAIPTGAVVVSIFADDHRLAVAAARTMVPINSPASPGGPLAPRLPDTGYGSRPLLSQQPSAASPAAGSVGR